MSEGANTPDIGPDADRALLGDKPMAFPPTGNPRVFGPGRGRNDERAVYLLFWLALAYLFWIARPEQGGSVLTGTNVAFYLLAALSLGATAFLIYRYPLQRVIVRVDDHGVTLRSLGRFHARDRTFVPFNKLKKVRMSRDSVSAPPWDMLRIDLRHGTGWISWEFAALTATGTEGREIAAEIARRAAASGMVVTPPEGPGYKKGEMHWHFLPPEDEDNTTGMPDPCAAKGPGPMNKGARRRPHRDPRPRLNVR